MKPSKKKANRTQEEAAMGFLMEHKVRAALHLSEAEYRRMPHWKVLLHFDIILEEEKRREKRLL